MNKLAFWLFMTFFASPQLSQGNSYGFKTLIYVDSVCWHAPVSKGTLKDTVCKEKTKIMISMAHMGPLNGHVCHKHKCDFLIIPYLDIWVRGVYVNFIHKGNKVLLSLGPTQFLNKQMNYVSRDRSFLPLLQLVNQNGLA